MTVLISTPDCMGVWLALVSGDRATVARWRGVHGGDEQRIGAVVARRGGAQRLEERGVGGGGGGLLERIAGARALQAVDVGRLGELAELPRRDRVVGRQLRRARRP